MNDKIKCIILGFLVVFIIALYFYLITRINTERFENKKPVVFLHIPKNAGTKIKKMYPKFNNKPHWDSYPKQDEINVAVIRNPTTRLQSIFSHIKYRQEVEKNAYDLFNFETLHDLATAYYDINHKYHKKAVSIFKWDDTSLQNYKSTAECSKSVHCIHWLPQHLYVDGYQPTIVDYLIRFEHLDEDITKLQKKGVLEPQNITNSKSRQTPDKYKNLAKITPICNKLLNDIYKKDVVLWEKVNDSTI